MTPPPVPPLCRRVGRGSRRCLLTALALPLVLVAVWLTLASSSLSSSSSRESSSAPSALSSFLLALSGRQRRHRGRESDPGPVWSVARGDAAGFAMRGRRPSMEDRFTIGSRVYATPGGGGVYGVYGGYGTGEEDYDEDDGDGGGRGSDVTGGRDGGDGDDEDRNSTHRIYGLFDGHGGEAAVDFVSRTLPQRLRALLAAAPPGQPDGAALRALLAREILATDTALLRHLNAIGGDESGSTCVLAVVSGDSLTVASVGDSRAVVSDGAGRAVPLTTEHKPYLPAERRRIQRAGGFIRLSGVWRVQGELAMSRALGDARLKRLGVITAQADVATAALGGAQQQPPGPRFLLLASDGLWDAVGIQEAVDLARAHADRPLMGAGRLATEAFRRGGGDNVAVLVVRVDGGGR